MINLPAQQQTLFASLSGKGDVPFADLYRALYPDGQVEGRAAQQQVLGPFVTRLNRRLAKHRMAVKPGDLKGTYRLIVT